MSHIHGPAASLGQADIDAQEDESTLRSGLQDRNPPHACWQEEKWCFFKTFLGTISVN